VFAFVTSIKHKPVPQSLQHQRLLAAVFLGMTTSV